MHVRDGVAAPDDGERVGSLPCEFGLAKVLEFSVFEIINPTVTTPLPHTGEAVVGAGDNGGNSGTGSFNFGTEDSNIFELFEFLRSPSCVANTGDEPPLLTPATIFVDDDLNVFWYEALAKQFPKVLGGRDSGRRQRPLSRNSTRKLMVHHFC
jgi:hypothetical protein